MFSSDTSDITVQIWLSVMWLYVLIAMLLNIGYIRRNSLIRIFEDNDGPSIDEAGRIDSTPET